MQKQQQYQMVLRISVQIILTSREFKRVLRANFDAIGTHLLQFNLRDDFLNVGQVLANLETVPN